MEYFTTEALLNCKLPNQDDSYSACVNYYCSENGGSLVRLGESGYNENDNFHFLVVYGVSPDEKP